jgi:hypothetical protein
MNQIPDHEQVLLAWRQKLDASLRVENSWLALANLYWLKEGLIAFGIAPTNGIVLPNVDNHLHFRVESGERYPRQQRVSISVKSASSYDILDNSGLWLLHRHPQLLAVRAELDPAVLVGA